MPPQSCLVVGIADGDTLTARCGAPGEYLQVKVRLAEIDALVQTPESKWQSYTLAVQHNHQI